jgi:hypothetical protein
MQSRHHPQRDLFLEERKPPDVPTPRRRLVVDLIASLLAEAIGDGSGEARATIIETTEGNS